MPFLRIASIVVLISFVLTHLLIKKDHLTTVWSEYAIDPKFGWVMGTGLIIFGIACILTGLFPNVFILTLVTRAGASVYKLKYLYLLVISGIANLGGTFVKTTIDKTKYLQRKVHLFFAVIELTFVPLFIVLNKVYVPVSLFRLAVIHLIIFAVITILFLLEKTKQEQSKVNAQNFKSVLSSVFTIGFLEKVMILMLIGESFLL